MTTRCADIESKAQDAERMLTSNIRTTSALKAAIDSAELYMQALRLADTPADRKRLDAKCKELLIKAEKLKSAKDARVPAPEMDHPVSPRKLTTRENIIILEGSKLNGFIFKPWDKPPSDTEFALQDNGQPFLDSPCLPLSEAQLEYFGGWQRPHQALALLMSPTCDRSALNDPSMDVREGRVDLVQDLTSDCSVVASMCSGSARVERGHAKTDKLYISGSVIYPYDHDKDTVVLSPNGKYIFKLFFNGTWRRVEIDDLLPTTTNARVLHVVDRSHPSLLWPALVEKAYLKVRGGYDFPGSNSGTDLAVLSGWIPQQVFLHDADVEPNKLWNELSGAFEGGQILLTVGTGKLSRREQRQLGLAAEHDYSILDMKDCNGTREMLIKNPWADGDVWKGASRRKPNPTHDPDEDYPDLTPINGSEDMIPGTFWMDFNSLFQHYEHLYINWNPALFNFRHDFHFSWSLSQRQPVSHILDSNRQFCIRITNTGEVWVLLNRHFRTGDYTHANSGKNGYISLYLYDRGSHRMLSSSGAHTRGPFVDSPNTLLRFNAVAGHDYVVAAMQQDLPAGKHNFTISLFSKDKSFFHEADSNMEHKDSLTAAWTRATAGGNSDSPNYLTNPQFKFTIQVSQQVGIVLKIVDEDGNHTTTTDTHVKISIIASDGQRITLLRMRDIIAHSGDYHKGSALVEKVLSKGMYTLICSTFEENELAKFSLDMYSAHPTAISQLPSEGSGRLRISPEPLLFQSEVSRYLAPLSAQTTTKVTFIARQAKRTPTSSLFRLSVEQGQGPYKKFLSDSSIDDELFNSISTGLRIDDAVLDPAMTATDHGGLWLVVERLAQGQQTEVGAETVSVEAFSENRIEIGTWGVGEG